MSSPGPAIERMMLPLLRFVALHEECQYDQAFDYIAQRLNLSDDERNQRLSSNPQVPIYQFRSKVAITHLHRAGLLERFGNKRQKLVRITHIGRAVFAQQPQAIDYRYLMTFEAYRSWQQEKAKAREEKRKGESDVDEQEDPALLEDQDQSFDQVELETPPNLAPIEVEASDSLEQIIEKAHKDTQDALRQELREKILEMSPAAFERLIVKFMLGMGYGGGRGTGEQIGSPSDGGIDGVVNQDLLGLDRICLQAKRYRDQRIGADKIREFIGSLGGNTKGVFVTTSYFTREAKETANKEQSKRVILIDGNDLARLLIEHDIAVRTYRTFELKRLDTDFFRDLDPGSRS